MRSARDVDERVALEAAEWQHALRTAGPEERARFVDWVRTSPRHLQEFLFMEALEAATDQADAQHRINIQALELASGDSVIPLAPPTARSSHAPSLRRAHQWAAALAAGVLVAVFAGWFISTRPTTFSTAIGEQRAVELPDGSVLELNAQSRVQVRLSNRRREIELVGGEALFKVSRDPARPFVVHAAGTEIRALGTQFNVKRRVHSMTVSVIEGKVAIGDVPLAAGEDAEVAADGHVKRGKVAIEAVSAWRQRRLVFRDDTLEDIAAEFNRYNKSPRIIVEDEAARSRRFGGTFDADDPESITQVLAGKHSLAIERRPGAILVRSVVR